MVICSSQETDCINCVGSQLPLPEICYLCRKTLSTWIKTSIHLDGIEEPIILCCCCAKEITKDIDKNSTDQETRELLEDVRECQEKSVPLCVSTILVLLLLGLCFGLWVFGCLLNSDLSFQFLLFNQFVNQ